MSDREPAMVKEDPTCTCLHCRLGDLVGAELSKPDADPKRVVANVAQLLAELVAAPDDWESRAGFQAFAEGQIAFSYAEALKAYEDDPVRAPKRTNPPDAESWADARGEHPHHVPRPHGTVQ